MCSSNCTHTIVRPSLLSRRSWWAVGSVVGGVLRRHLGRLPGILREWRQRARSRRYLVEMSDRDLKDVGISRSEADREADLPFWRASDEEREQFPKAVAIARDYPFD